MSFFFSTKLYLSLLFMSGVVRNFSYSAETCSRKALVNYQEVLVDASSNRRGEGLRYYLAKDPVAEKLLTKYQDQDIAIWKTAGLSTTGTLMILAGFLRGSSGDKDILTSRQALFAGGIGLIGVSYLISRTNQYKNEWILQEAVDEYNKRNTPQIFFNVKSNKSNESSWGVGVTKDF
jgi:hypothetical protein